MEKYVICFIFLFSLTINKIEEMNKMLPSSEDFKPFLDKYKLIAQKDSYGADGGDSAHRFGLAYSALKLMGSPVWLDGVTPLNEYYHYAMLSYEQHKDEYVRHPDPSKWYSNPLNFSRDQTTMLMKAMLVEGDNNRLRGLMGQLFKRFGLHNNIYDNYVDPKDYGYEKMKSPDIMTPAQIGDWLRSYKSPWLYPVLCIIDSARFLDVYFAALDDKKSKAKGKRTDYYVMLATDIAVNRSVQDTFVLRWAAKLLSKTDYKSSIQWIFKPEHNDPPLDKLLIPLYERYIDNAN